MQTSVSVYADVQALIARSSGLIDFDATARSSEAPLQRRCVSDGTTLLLNVIGTATISGHKELRMLQLYSHLRAVELVDRLG